MKVIVSDTTSLIALEGLNAISLLCSIFENVLIPQAVFDELYAGSPAIVQKIHDACCIEIIQLEPSEQLTSLQLILDRGEAEAITLALERQLPILIDERKGRNVALQKQLIVTGFVGLLILATKKHKLTSQTAQQLLNEAVKNGFRISDKLYQQVVQTLKNLS